MDSSGDGEAQGARGDGDDLKRWRTFSRLPLAVLCDAACDHIQPFTTMIAVGEADPADCSSADANDLYAAALSEAVALGIVGDNWREPSRPMIGKGVFFSWSSRRRHPSITLLALFTRSGEDLQATAAKTEEQPTRGPFAGGSMWPSPAEQIAYDIRPSSSGEPAERAAPKAEPGATGQPEGARVEDRPVADPGAKRDEKQPRQWGDVKLALADNRTLRVSIGGGAPRRVTDAELGLSDGRSASKTTLPWDALVQLIEQGHIPLGGVSNDTIRRLRDALKGYFKIDANPIPVQHQTAYLPAFHR